MVSAKLMTADEFLTYEDAGKRFELIAGEIVEMPVAGGVHGHIEFHILAAFAALPGVATAGWVLPGDTGFFFGHDPDLVRFPDIAFVRRDRLPPLAERSGFLDVIPDLVVEIHSPSERLADFVTMIEFYLRAGVPLAWAVYAATRTVEVWRPGQFAQTLHIGEVLTAEDLLPGLQLPVADIFP